MKLKDIKKINLIHYTDYSIGMHNLDLNNKGQNQEGLKEHHGK